MKKVLFVFLFFIQISIFSKCEKELREEYLKNTFKSGLIIDFYSDEKVIAWTEIQKNEVEE